MAVRSRALAFAPTINETAVTLFTVPAGRTALIRHITVENISTTAAVEAVLVVRRSGLSVGILRQNVPSRATISHPGLAYVLEPLDELRAVAVGVGGSFRAIVCGSLLLGAPE